MSKRKRDATFAASEKLALVEVVERHFNIVENKKTDAASVAEKREEWRKIATEFNTVSCLHPREWEVLKNCWENLKKKAKNKLTLQNQHFLGTGGGPPKKIIDDPAIERVLQLIQSRVSGFVNEYDSDNTQVIASSQPDTLSVRIADEEHDTVLSDISNTVLVQESESGPILDENISTEAATTMTLDWSQYNPSMLREPMNHILGRLESPLPDRQQPAQPDVTFSDAQQLHHTPSRIHTRAPTLTAARSRRRPVLRHDTSQSLNNERIHTLTMTNKHAQEEHDIHMRILQHQEEQEKVKLQQENIKLQQEKIKLELLQIQLNKLKE